MASPPDRWPDTTAREAAYNAIKWLDETNLGLLETKDTDDDLPYLRFSPDAQRVADQWRNELEIRLRGDECKQTPAFEAHLGKYRSLMPSLALIFHSGISQEKNSEVALEDVELAANWCAYLEAHARIVYQAEVSPGVDAACKLADKIKTGHIRDGEPVREIYRHEWSGLATSSQVNAGLEVLASAGWVRVVSQPTKGAPTTVVQLNPRLIGENNG